MIDKAPTEIRSEYLRELLLRCCDGVFHLWPLLQQINLMVRAEEACLWLIKNRLTGKNLFDLWFHEHDKSFIQVIAIINKGLEKEDKVRHVLASRDFGR